MIWSCIIGGFIGFLAGIITKKEALWALLLRL